MPRSTYRTTFLLASAASIANAFVAPSTTARMASSTRDATTAPLPTISTPSNKRTPVFQLSMTTDPNLTNGNKLSISLEKPLGLILEENDGSIPSFSPGGVIVTQVNEGGSAFESTYKNALAPSKITSVMGKDVSTLSFDEVMDEIIGAPSPLDVGFDLSAAAVAELNGVEMKSYDIGETVQIRVQQPEKGEIVIDAKVGDNLRKTLLANDVEVYRGLKKKLGNCGGSGTCGFCCVEFTDDEGVWGERSDYEAKKIGKNGSENARLACMNNIVGPATVCTL